MNNATDPLTFLSQSKNRVEILQLLQDGERLDRYEIEEQVEASRRTVIRTLDALTDRGYLVESGDGYQPTSFGSYIAEVYQTFASDTAFAHQLKPVLANVPSDEFDLDPQYLADTEIAVATQGSPYALLDRTLAIRSEASQIREVAPFIEKKSVEQLVERIENQEAFNVEAVLPVAVIEAVGDHPEYREAHQQIKQSDHVDLYVYPDEVTLPVCIADDTVIICVLRDEKLYALAVSSHPEVKAWAEQRFQTFREKAQRIEAVDLSESVSD